MTLSIVVITMNRAEQLRSALLSCVNSELPDKVEFIVIDNASIDNTEVMVHEFFIEHKFPYTYEKEEVNLGVGGGRNRGFDLAHGEFVYFLDDDAIVSPESYESFFRLPIATFRKDDRIASITTKIYDEALGCNREVRYAKNNEDPTKPDILMFLGGSHFLRKSCYASPLYLDFKYGMEELYPSLFVLDKGLRNCYLNQIKVIHQPIRNKWKSGSEEMNSIIVRYNVNCYISKRTIYPNIYRPLLYVTFLYRTMFYFRLNHKMWKESIWNLKEGKKRILAHTKKIKNKTIFFIIKNYSLGTAF